MAAPPDIHGIGPDEPRRYWYTSLAELGEKRLRELGAKYDAAYVLTEAPGVQLPETEISPQKPAPRLDLTVLYHNSGYVIYGLAPRRTDFQSVPGISDGLQIRPTMRAYALVERTPSMNSRSVDSGKRQKAYSRHARTFSAARVCVSPIVLAEQSLAIGSHPA